MKKTDEIKALRCWSEQCNGATTPHTIIKMTDNHFLDENGLPFDLKLICQNCQHTIGTWFNLLP